MISPLALGTAIFVLLYVLIVVEKWHKTAVALGGASLVLLLKLVTQEEAFHSQEYGVDWNVIFLLISMMIIIGIMRETGVFQWTAIKSAKWGKGRPFRILLIFCVVTALLSALLDNVTTVLLIAPVTILVARQLDVDPVPFLIAEALARREPKEPDVKPPGRRLVVAPPDVDRRDDHRLDHEGHAVEREPPERDRVPRLLREAADDDVGARADGRAVPAQAGAQSQGPPDRE